MANKGEVTLVFKVAEDGSLKLATNNINKAAKASDNLAESQTRAATAGNKHNSALNGGVTSANNAARGMSRLVESMGDNNSGLVAAYAILATNAFAVGAAFNTLRSAAQVELLLKGLEVQGSRTGRNLLAVSSSIQEITKNSISAADAMTAASLGSAAGLNAADLEALTSVATNASIALGRNLPDSMDRVIKGVTKLEPELLDELGLMTKLTEATEKYARAQGKSAESLTGLEKRRAFVEAIKAEGEIKFGGISDQVDVNSFDQLAATFMNLTNSVLGFIAASAPVQAILDLLINSSLGLTGALTVLASTMSGPINTWLGGMATAAAKAAADLSDVAVAQERVAKSAVAASKGRLEKAGVAATEAAQLTQKQPAGYRDIEAKRARGEILSLQEKDKAINSLERSTAIYESRLKKLTELQKSLANSNMTLSDTDQAKMKNLNTEIAANNARIASYDELGRATENLQKRTSEATAKQKQAEATRASQISKQQTSIALEAAASGSPVKAFTAASASVSAYKEQLQATTAATAATAAASGRTLGVMSALTPAVNAAKVGFFGLGLGIRAVGSAIMAALPYLGLIILAFSGLQLLYEKFFVTEAEKAKEKALEDLKITTDSVANSIKELNRLADVEMQQGVKATKILEIRLNTLLELADAYEKLTEASTKAANSSKLEADNLTAANSAIKAEEARLRAFNMERGRYATGITQEEDYDNIVADMEKRLSIANEAGVKFESAAVGLFAPSTETEGFIPTWNAEAIESIRILEQLERTNPEVAKRFYEIAKATDSHAKKTELLNKALQEARAEYSPIRDKVMEFTEALKAAETAQADFLKSLRPTTPYDNVAASFQAVSTSMSDLEALMGKKGSLAAEDFSQSFQQVITQLGPNVASALDQEGQMTLNTYNAIGQQMARLNQEQEDGLDVTREIGLVRGIQTRLETRLADIIPQQVEEYNALLASAQQQHILAGSQITLAQARLSLLQRQGTVTGADIKRQMQAQNAVIAAQIAQEKIKLNFIKLDLQRLQVSLLEIQTQKEYLKDLEERINKQGKINRLVELARITAERTRLEAKGASAAELRALDIQAAAVARREITDPAARARELERLDRAQTAAIRQISLVKAGAAAIENNIAAMSMGMTSAIEQNTAAALQDLKNAKEIADIQRRTEETRSNINSIERDTLNILSLGSQELQNQLTALRRQAELKAEQITADINYRKSELNFQIKLARARGNVEQVDYYTRLRDAEIDSAAAALELNEAERDRSILNAVAIKSIEEQNELKRKSIELEQRLAQTINDSIKSQQDYNAAVRSLDRRRAGLEETDASRQNEAIRAAQEAYELVQRESAIKIALIRLEFELLDAQRQQTIRDLRLRAQTLRDKAPDAPTVTTTAATAAAPEAGEAGDIEVTARSNLRASYLQQSQEMETQAENLEKVGTRIPAAVDAAISSVLQQVETLGVKLEEALTPGPRVTGPLIQTFNSMMDRVKTFKLQAAAAQASRADADPKTNIPDPSKADFVLGEFEDRVNRVRESLKELGPEGELVLALADSSINISSMFTRAFDTISSKAATNTEKIVAGMQAALAVISGVMSILKASSDAKIANIDREIAAEERRDGKSAASLAKLEVMEKKKDSIARKQFNTNKKLMMAQAVVSTAAGVAGALSLVGTIGPAAFALAGLIGALGMAQVAIIAGTQYESTMTPRAASSPSTLSIGKRGDSVNLAGGPSANAGGEVGFLRGSQGTGTNASNFRTIGSAYGGDLMRGYGNRGFVVGEKGPERIDFDTPISVTPANDTQMGQPLNATFNIQALDSRGVEDIIVGQKGNIIKMLRDAANASGQGFLEDVNVDIYTRPNIGKL